MPSLSRRRLVFGAFFAGLALLGVLAVALVNYAVDPYGVFGVAPVPGFNAVKPRPDVMLREIKFILGKRARPQALIIGNSRAEVGFDPQHPVFRMRQLRGFNAAVPGSGTEYAAAALQRFAASDEIQVAVVGLDFLDFLYAPNETERPASSPAPQWATTRTRLLALFSSTAAIDSVTTLLIQRERNPATLRADGFNPMLDYRDIAAREGYFALFRQRALESARNLAKQPHNLYVGGPRTSPSFAALEAMLRTAGEKGIELRFVIYPYHRLLMSQLRDAGLWPLFEQWKTDVTALIDDARRRGVRVSLWDFACPDGFTDEPVPAPGDRAATMQWYWEAGHFKKELGDRVLARIFDDPGASESFGFELSAANVADRNLACRRALAATRSSAAADGYGK
jgi:hypothetical protein